MDKFNQPEPLSFEGNVAENWRRWKQRFQIFMTATGTDTKGDEVKYATLLHFAGPEALEIYNTFTWTVEGDKKNISKILEKFEEYCTPRKNITWERHIFNTKVQQPGESIDHYATDLRKKASSCEFGILRDSLIRDRIVCGICDDRTRSRLLKEADLTLEKAVDMCRADEITASQIKTLAQPAQPELGLQLLKNNSKFTTRRKQECGWCGETHPQGQCPAFGKYCDKCGKRNHFAKVCRSAMQKKCQNVQTIDDDDSDDDNDLFVDTICGDKNKKDWQVQLAVNRRKLSFKIDTGAQCNVISKTMFDTVSKAPLVKSNARLVAFGGHKIVPFGKATLLCEHKKKLHPIQFQVVDNVPNVLGLKTSTELNIIKRVEGINSQHVNDPLKEFADVFTGLGCVSNVVHHINIKPNVQPVVHPPRRVPVTIRSKVKTELQRMERLNVIEKINEPTEWVNSMAVVVKPNGKLRICIDPRDLNQAIRREYYPMTTIEEIVAHTPNAKIFSVLDASSGFWKIHLDNESARVCTFNTPFGRYMFKRLPFGISSAQDVFQRIMSEIFQDIEGVEVLVDDILVWTETEEQHDRILNEVLSRARSRNLKLNIEKSQIKCNEVRYAGHILSKTGLKPDPKKVEAITNICNPKNKEELQQFLGMVTYLAKFIPNYSQVAAPLRLLLEKDIEWHWTAKQTESFETLKELISNTPVLQYFDPKKQVILSVDASSKGIGAVLFQDNRPVAYASKSLTTCQQNYAQIEKEMLAIVFGCTRFHDYIYGLPNVGVESDHKPLESILKKLLHQAPLRLQRMIMSLQKYPITVCYKPGKELLVADALSRSPLPEEASDLELKKYDISSLHLLPISETKLEIIKQKTLTDNSLQELSTMIKRGWPSTRSATLPGAKPYWNFRDEVSIIQGILFKGEKVIIPMEMRKKMLQIIHNSHLGIEKCKRRARDVLYWPGMSSEIEDFVSTCEICTKYQGNNRKEPLIPHAVPSRPWSKVGADLFEFQGKYFLILVDYYSKFIEVAQLKHITSLEIINHCKSQFARHGIPDIFFSDNGPQFSSSMFDQFSIEYGFQHHTSSPYHPQSNGMAEKAVQTIKNILRKVTEDKKDFYLALLDLRNTPICDDTGSPTQRLMGRKTKTLLPTTQQLLIPKQIKPQAVKRKYKIRRTNRNFTMIDKQKSSLH